MSGDQPSALLTSGQRTFLKGEADFDADGSRGRTTRTRLRRRIHRGIQDFRYLADPTRLDDRDLELLLEDESEGLKTGFEEMVAFLYRAHPEAAESIIDAGITLGVRRVSPGYSVDDVTISVRKHGAVLRRARERMERDEALTDRQVRILLEESDLPAEKVQDYVRSHRTPSPITFR